MPADERHAVEVKLAVAEATCAQTTSFADTAKALQSHYLERASRPYAQENSTILRQFERAALGRAMEIIRSS